MPAGRVTGATSSPASPAEPRYRHSCLVPASVTAAPSSPKLIFGASLACPANPMRTRVSLVPDAGRWRCRMGLMDRVREQAAQVAQRTAQVTQEAALQGKAKLDQAQAKRRADAMFRDLGAAVYAERTGRGGTDTADKIERLVSALSQQEAGQGLGGTEAPAPARTPRSSDGAGRTGAAGPVVYPGHPGCRVIPRRCR